MDNQTIVGMIVMGLCTFGCGFLFWGIAKFGKNSTKPMNFWAGEFIDPKTVSDIAAYNLECATMWRRYSAWYFLSGVLSCFNLLHEGFLYAAVVVLIFAGTVGIWLLIREYRRIEEGYIAKPGGLNR